MTRLKRAIGVCTLAGALFQAAAVYSATYYVATTGNNGNPGTEEQPWQTVAHAVKIMVAGDTTFVRGGTYNEIFINFRRSGTSTAPIKLLNYPGESPKIHCVDHLLVHRISIVNASGSRFPIGWIMIEGFEIEHCYNGIKWVNLHDSVIRRNWIHDARDGSGIVGAGSLRVTIDRNIFSQNAITDPTGNVGGHGIYINGSYVTVTNNIFYDNRGYNIQLNGSSGYGAAFDPAKHPSAEFANSNNWVIANNTLAYSRRAAGLVIWGNLANNTLVENNIFYENAAHVSDGPQGINFISAGSTGILIRNNLHYASGTGATAFLGRGAIEGVHYTQSGNISQNPLFINGGSNSVPASPNFALTERSPAIDRGLHLAAITKAFDGTPRPQRRTYDIGAYEYKTEDDVKSPAAPVALQVR